jgi:hypothetical protein
METMHDTLNRQVADLPDGHLIRVLLDQHVRIRMLFAAVAAAEGGLKQELFDQLRLLLAVHESAEERHLRPIARAAAGSAVVEARLAEESEAARIVAELELLDVAEPAFAARFDDLERAVLAHAEREEAEEFPGVLEHGEVGELTQAGFAVITAECWAPVHPTPDGTGTLSLRTFGPFAALLERSRRGFRNLG